MFRLPFYLFIVLNCVTMYIILYNDLLGVAANENRKKYC